MASRQRLFSPSQEWWSSAIFVDSGSLSRWRRALRLVRHTVRLPVSLDKALRSLAEQQGIGVYAMLQRSVKAGVATLADPPAPSTATPEIVSELASVSTRIVDVERMLDRALFTACDAYCYADRKSVV